VRVVDVADPADPRLDDFRNLTDADVRPDRRGIVIAEGVTVVQRLAASPYRVRAVIGVTDRLAAVERDLRAHDVPGYAVDKWVLSEVVGFRVTRGILAAADRGADRTAAELLAAADRVVVLEGLNDFENLGALFRNAAAFGVQAVLMDPRCADPLYRRSVRVSMGHVLAVPFARLPAPWPESLAAVRAAGHRLLALTPGGGTPLAELVAPPRWALLAGAEGPGLTDGALAAADTGVRIPMAPGVDSLNVATATALALARLTGAC